MGSYNCVRPGTAQKLAQCLAFLEHFRCWRALLRNCGLPAPTVTRQKTAPLHPTTHSPPPLPLSTPQLVCIPVQGSCASWPQMVAAARGAGPQRTREHLSCQASPRSRWTTHAVWCFLRMYVQIHVSISWHEVQSGGAAARADVGGGAASLWCNCERRGRVAGGQLRYEALMGSSELYVCLVVVGRRAGSPRARMGCKSEESLALSDSQHGLLRGLLGIMCEALLSLKSREAPSALNPCEFVPALNPCEIVPSQLRCPSLPLLPLPAVHCHWRHRRGQVMPSPAVHRQALPARTRSDHWRGVWCAHDQD